MEVGGVVTALHMLVAPLVNFIFILLFIFILRFFFFFNPTADGAYKIEALY